MNLKTPVIMLNVKSYVESMGQNDLGLAKNCQEVAKETGANIVYCPQQVDLAWITKEIDIPCFAQHSDAFNPGSKTGWTVLEAVKAAGAVGTLVNHSEHRMGIADIEAIVQKSKGLDLATVVCTNNTAVSTAVAEFGPTSIAIEPPELIGSGIPVSKADPEIVSGSVAAVRDVDKDIVVLCGAGISTGEDVKAAIELGAKGVLLASGVVKAEDQKAVLLNLASGIL
ncbi:MAG: triose-phosphate isomerase [Candidatus Hydrothermarchaeaceae archaeon]